jgi:predicted nucleic acid-binding Zn ribbon protein
MTNDEATPLGAVLQALLKQTGLDKKMKEFSVLEAWDEVVGLSVARATTSKKFEHGKLIVIMVSPVWRAEIKMRVEPIRQALNERAGAEVVKEILVR